MILAIFIVVLFVPSVSHAVCSGSSPSLIAASTNIVDINDCVSVAVDGDTINVPAGVVTWGSTLSPSNKAISIIGAGIGNSVVTGTGAGIVQWNTKATGSSPAGFTRLSGFTFKSGTGSAGCNPTHGPGSDTITLVDFHGLSHNVRVDHNRFEGTACGGLHIHGDVRGVSDHNQYDNISASGVHMVPVEHELWDNVSSLASRENGDGSWAAASSIGTANAFVFEDDQFINTLAGGGFGQYMFNDFQGARVVVRFSTFTSSQWTNHGTESGGRVRGDRQHEIYRNQFNWGLGSWPSVAGSRGGTGMVFDNDATSGPTTIFDGRDYRTEKNNASYWVFGYCGTKSITSITRSGSTATATVAETHGYQTGGQTGWVTIAGATQPEYNGTSIPITPISSTQFTYTVSGTPATPATGTITEHSVFDGPNVPCTDQVGAGAGNLLRGTEPGVTSPNPNPPVPMANILDPIYIWNNKVAGVLSQPIMHTSSVIRQNIEYYQQNQLYNGTSQRGIGRGPRSSRPTSCTPGDAWWATDQGSWNTSTTETYSDTPGEDGVQDRCTSLNSWTNAVYVPLTYPHPLISGASSPSASASITAPVAGSNYTPSQTITVTGTALAGSGALSRVDVYINGVLACSDTVASFSPWTCNATAPATNGTYSLTARATDTDGQGPSSVGVSFNVVSGGGGGGATSSSMTGTMRLQ